MIHDGPNSGRDPKTGLMRRQVLDDNGDKLFDVVPTRAPEQFAMLKEVVAEITHDDRWRDGFRLEQHYDIHIRRKVFDSFNDEEQEIIMGSFHKVFIEN